MINNRNCVTILKREKTMWGRYGTEAREDTGKANEYEVLCVCDFHEQSKWGLRNQFAKSATTSTETTRPERTQIFHS